MTETAVAEEVWDDTTYGDELLGLPAKVTLWVSYGLLALSFLAITFISMTLIFDSIAEAEATGFDVDSNIKTLIVFASIYSIASFAFATGLFLAGVLNPNSPNWARVTMLCVSGLLLVGNGVASMFLFNSGFDF